MYKKYKLYEVYRYPTLSADIIRKLRWQVSPIVAIGRVY
jgi:hypothetical protein